jgi:hypothetical protein
MLVYNQHVYGKWLETSIIKRDDDLVVEYCRDLHDNTHADLENK